MATFAALSNKELKQACHASVQGRFAKGSQKLPQATLGDPESSADGYTIHGVATLNDGSSSKVVCNFDATGTFRSIGASAPTGGKNTRNQAEGCPVDVSEADRYRYPAFN